ncbi:hypothetical protein [Cohnella fermenti]|uniref:Carboxypeptidase regulatory-like domain-containing protein n=1 Tax=Cohnella fermenti TaxID=2565925 RepID=A0A4V3WDQ0_9BACL|nr:hypothetical protein [Cohnella fermenti]THF72998.1 hypothetical protein E6C55_31120 [Cohnella fermenti]
MANKRPKPGRVDSKKFKIIKYAKKDASAKRETTFTRLSIVWVQQNGVPYDTTGFIATLTRNNSVVATAAFDENGVARFSNVRVLTSRAYTLRTFDSDGILYRTRSIPAGVQAYAVIG